MASLTQSTPNGTHALTLIREADLTLPAYVCPVLTHRGCACVRPAYAALTTLKALPCPAGGCGATFLTQTALHAHHLAAHERPAPAGLSGSDRGVQPAEASA